MEWGSGTALSQKKYLQNKFWTFPLVPEKIKKTAPFLAQLSGIIFLRPAEKKEKMRHSGQNFLFLSSTLIWKHYMRPSETMYFYVHENSC